MTESVSEATESNGRTRIILALIPVAGAVVLALVNGLPGKIGGGSEEPSPAAVTAAVSPSDPGTRPPKLWRIEGRVEPAEARRVALRLVPVDGVLEISTDSQGRFEFPKVPAGVYRLFVVRVDADHDVNVLVKKDSAQPVGFVDVADPLALVTITEQ